MITRVAARKLESCRIEFLALSHQHVEWLARFFEWQALGLVEETRWAKSNIRAIRFDISITNWFAEFWKRFI